eukprot:UN01253
MKLISFLIFVLCTNIFQKNFSPEAEIAKLFESTKRKCLDSDGMYFLKTKFESSFLNEIQNKFYFELKVYNSPGFCSMLCLTILD